MIHRVRTFLRRLLLTHDSSDQPTSLMPLDSLRSVVVLRDVEKTGNVDEEIVKYFKRRGMTVRFMSRKDLTLRSKEEFFISLVPDADIDELYAAVSSQAKFKVGTHPLKDGVLDLVVKPAKTGDKNQLEVFKAITRMLEKIK